MFDTGAHIYYYRLEKGLTQAQLARQSGLAQPNLSNIEKGKQDLTVSTLRRIAAALEVAPAQLLEAPLSDQDKNRPLLTRAFMEEIATAVVNPAKKVSVRTGEIAELFRNILPLAGRPLPVKESRQAWVRLKKQFTPQEIRSLYQRIQDARQRQP